MITIYLGTLARDSRVIIDGVDVSAHVVAVELHADIADEPTEVVITLTGPVEIHGAPGEVVIEHLPTEPLN